MSLTNNAAVDALETLIQNAANPYTYPLQLALFTSAASAGTDPGETIPNGVAPVTNEVATSGTAYARVSVVFGTAPSIVAGDFASISNTAVITFPTATANWADGSSLYVNGWGLYSSNATPNAVWHGAFDVGKGVLNGDTATIAIGNLTLRAT